MTNSEPTLFERTVGYRIMSEAEQAMKAHHLRLFSSSVVNLRPGHSGDLQTLVFVPSYVKLWVLIYVSQEWDFFRPNGKQSKKDDIF